MSADKQPARTEQKKDGTLRYSHDAYGVVVLTESSGSRTLFGSDIEHSQAVCIELRGAHLDRSLHRNWILSGDLIARFEMSHAQFAQFITSAGKGGGTPCTITNAPVSRQVAQMPDIQKLESTHQVLDREVRDSATRQMGNVLAEIDRLGTLIEGGKISKTALKEIHGSLKAVAENIPSNLSYAVRAAQGSIEKMTADAKIEIEAYLDSAARRMGIESISQMKRLESDKS